MRNLPPYRHSPKEPRQKRDWFDYVTLGVAAAGVIVIAVTAVISAKQVSVAHKQIDEMQAEQRPWVRADISVGGPITYDSNGVTVPVHFTLKNVGHTPATNVWIHTKVIAPDIVTDPPIDVRSEMVKMIEDLKKRSPPLGVFIFPDQIIEETVNVTIGAQELQRITRNTEFIVPKVIGAVNYRIGPKGEPHQTGFIFDIQRSNAPRDASIAKKRNPAAIFPDEGDIAASEVRFLRSFLETDFVN